MCNKGYGSVCLCAIMSVSMLTATYFIFTLKYHRVLCGVFDNSQHVDFPESPSFKVMVYMLPNELLTSRRNRMHSFQDEKFRCSVIAPVDMN